MLKDLVALSKELTLQQVFVCMFAGASFIFLWVVWEQRDAVFITLTGNMSALVSMAFGFGLLFVAGVAWLFVAALDRKTAETIKALTERIKDGEAARADLQREIDRLRDRLDTVVHMERESCAQRLKEQRELLTSRHRNNS